MREIFDRNKHFGHLIKCDPKNTIVVNPIYFLCGGAKKDLPAYIFPVKILESKRNLPCSINGFDIVADGACSHYNCGEILDDFYVRMLLEDGKYKDMQVSSREDVQKILSEKDLFNPIFINVNGTILDTFETNDNIFFIVESNVCLHESMRQKAH